MARRRDAGLKNRLFLAALGVLLLVCAAIVWQSRVIIFKTLTLELSQRGVGIAQSIAERGVPYILGRDRVGLTNLLFDEARVHSRRELVAYIFVVDAGGELLAHTFVTHVPWDVVAANPLPPDKESSVTLVQEERREAYDVAVPVMGGIYRIATVHVGLSKAHIDSLRGRLRTTTIGLILALGVLVFIVSFRLLDVVNQRETAILMERNKIQQERIVSLQKLSAAVAHQIRNPVMIIGGFARLLGKGRDNPEKRAYYIEAILETTSRLERIIRAVRELSVLQLGRTREADLAELVRTAKALAERMAAEAGLTDSVAWRLETKPIRAEVDEGLLVQALAEAMLNAVESTLQRDASRSGTPGVVRVTARREGDKAVIEVEDDGRGVAEADLPFVFDPFFSDKPVGVGIGLAKAKRIMEEHHGDVYLRNRQGGGAVATLVLPLRQETGPILAGSGFWDE